MKEESQPRSSGREDHDTFVLPMSFGQEQLWLIDQMAPGNTAYNVLAPFRIRGPLETHALERTLNEILRRHEVLRTTFDQDDSGLVQVIASVAKISFTCIDLCDVPEDVREAELSKRMSAAGTLPFDLKQGPLCRAHLFKLGADHHVLLWNMHHIVSDGWSYTILTQEIGSILSAFTRGEPCPLPELPIQYGDFSQWQREQFTPERIAREAAWWKRQLEGAPAVLELPTDRPFGPTPSFAGRTRILHFKPHLIGRVQAVAKSMDTTLFTTTFAAFFVLLHRYTGQLDIVAGTPTANRGRVELESLIGYFVNTLPIRLSLRGDESFREVVATLQRILEGAYEHQELPFEKLVAVIQPDRARNRNSIFQVSFQCHKAFITLPQVPGLEFSHIHIDRQGTPVDLNLAMIDRDGHWRISAEYSTEVFNESTIDRMLGHYQVLLEGIVSNCAQRLSDLPMLTERERTQLLVDWNPRGLQIPSNNTIHGLFETQVSRLPGAIAVVDETKQITYAELNCRANRIARCLRGLGAKPDTLVALYVERDLDLLVCILAILKSGAAYVPLDPVYPAERIAFMLEDARPLALLTQRKVAGKLPSCSTKIICLEEVLTSATEPGAEKNLPPAAGPDDLAYIIYTSGTTGMPKGSMITHRNVVRLFSSTEAWYGFNQSDVWTLFHSSAFDFSVWEIWGALFYGGRIVVVPFMASRSPEVFYELLVRERVTVLNQTPSAFRQLIQAEESVGQKELALRYVIFGGEALEMQSLRPWFARHGDQRPRLVNMYGITETTVHVTYRPLSRDDLDSGSVIGVPLPDLQAYILDSQRQPVPIGVPGELYVGGVGLGRGYLHRPELTAERFIPDHLSGQPGQRLYRTGDRARFLLGRDIEYLGRLDLQVKIRGFRIELGEIESVVCQHPAVRETAVLVREDAPGNRQLIAYAVVKGTPPSVMELRQHLKKKLPDYMLPVGFVFLEKLPLNTNGKVDRKALPAPNLDGLDVEQNRVAPHTITQQLLCIIWCQVLGLKQVGIQDNFFDLGGNSLLAVKLQAQVEKRLGKRLPLATFFQSPTIAELSELIRVPLNSAERLCLLTPQFRADQPPLFCLHFLDSARRLAKHLDPNRPVYALESPFDEELRFWHEHHQITISMEELARRCLAVIRNVQPKGPYYLMGFCFGGTLAFEVARQLASGGEKIALLGLVDAFYVPGCRRLAMPWLRRWAYHARRMLVEGISYFSRKARDRQAVMKRRSSQLNAVRAGNRVLDQGETETLRLPQAHFMSQIIRPYRARPYAGNAILIRSAVEPSFSSDPGPTNGWDVVIQGGLKVADLECGHMEIAEEPHVQEVAKWLDQHLSSADADFCGSGKSSLVCSAALPQTT